MTTSNLTILHGIRQFRLYFDSPIAPASGCDFRQPGDHDWHLRAEVDPWLCCHRLSHGFAFSDVVDRYIIKSTIGQTLQEVHTFSTRDFRGVFRLRPIHPVRRVRTTDQYSSKRTNGLERVHPARLTPRHGDKVSQGLDLLFRDVSSRISDSRRGLQ